MYNLYNATIAVVGEDKTRQITRQLGIEIEKILSTKPKILMTTSENVTKRLKIKQEMYMITKER